MTKVEIVLFEQEVPPVMMWVHALLEDGRIVVVRRTEYGYNAKLIVGCERTQQGNEPFVGWVKITE